MERGLPRDVWMGLLHFDGRYSHSQVQFPFHRVPSSETRMAFRGDEAGLGLGFFAFGLCFPMVSFKTFHATKIMIMITTQEINKMRF